MSVFIHKLNRVQEVLEKQAKQAEEEKEQVKSLEYLQILRLSISYYDKAYNPDRVHSRIQFFFVPFFHR